RRVCGAHRLIHAAARSDRPASAGGAGENAPRDCPATTPSENAISRPQRLLPLRNVLQFGSEAQGLTPWPARRLKRLQNAFKTPSKRLQHQRSLSLSTVPLREGVIMHRNGLVRAAACAALAC